ncbi:MAG: GNAT family N-acetyltransferase [Bacteroidetes bacterium]|nr:GNAT family N-acetyltransferase [Bacteroidota bacterium]
MLIETERLLIRDLRSTDDAFILELVNEPAFHQHIGDKGIRHLEDARAYIQKAGAENYERLGFGMYLVMLKDSSMAIGICGILKRDFLDHPDLGFAYTAANWNKGYGTEAANAIIHWATTSLGIQTLSAITAVTNPASVRLLEKSGFKSHGEQYFPGRKEKLHLLMIDFSTEPNSTI